MLFSHSKQWLSVGFIAGILFFIIRYRELSYLPIVSLFDITFFFAWLLSAGYILFVKEGMGRLAHVLALTIVNGIFISDLFLDKAVHPLNPLLNSYWLGIHVPAVILAYSAFGISFAISVYYIIADTKRTP
ncbi:MAG: cytochrome c biogenesis protein CcsA, partial [Candidatus Omnitrophica bacterium]|nr:cytochrome c biogenesis protein CcsA [Candidatus Omnitrophota bacterium]